MWLVIIVAILALAAVHVWWRARLQRLESEFQRKLAEQKAKEEQSSNQLKAQRDALFNSMAEGLLLLDDSGRIQLANRAFGEMFGLTADIRSRTESRGPRGTSRESRQPTVIHGAGSQRNRSGLRR